MRIKILGLLTVFFFLLAFATQIVGGGGKGKGGGRPTNAVAASFEFSDPDPFISPFVTGDSALPYETDALEGVNAIIMGSGNPSLEMAADLENAFHRTLFVELDPDDPDNDCLAPASFEGTIGGDGTVNVNSALRLWFNNMKATPSGEENLPIPAPGENVVPNEPFRGLEVGAEGYTVMILRFLAQDPLDEREGGYQWYLIAGSQNGNNPDTQRVKVTRDGPYQWTVTGLESDSKSLARVTRSYTMPVNKKKTVTVTEDMGHCSAHINLVITEELPAP